MNLNFSDMKINILSVFIFAAIMSLSSCATLTKTQRMERDMFDPKPTRFDNRVIRSEGVALPKNKVKMPKHK